MASILIAIVPLYETFFDGDFDILPFDLLLVLLVSVLLEMNHSNAATYLTTKNEVPFLSSSLISGVVIVVASIISVVVLELGLLGVLLSYFLTQLSFNNWYWPYVAFKDLKKSENN